jgi:hypothetical protein
MTNKPTNWQALCADIVRAADAVEHDAAAAEGDFLAAVDNARTALTKEQFTASSQFIEKDDDQI